MAPATDLDSGAATADVTRAVLATGDNIPYLAPELQVLFKSIRPKNDVDANAVIPRLEPERRIWLCDQLPSDHRWQRLTSIPAL
ncbi:MAG: hypothetical protein GY773_06050 [Actinomycetia bacterium]|nr:hypothetical protein [Actinomycetes bacterium]MCP5035706.1 hypothetical protein [Actinomycetes bacterium]